MVQRDLDRLVRLLVLLGLYYQWYRYPFQINDSGTSPTYADTPAWISAGKYLLLSAVLGWALLWRVRGPTIRLPHPLTIVAFLFLALVPMAAGVAVGRVELLESGLFFTASLALFAFAGWTVSARRMDRVLVWAVYLALVVEGIQLILFFAFGRLPALAFANSFLVRFGSFLDDPNSWGMVGIWLLFYAAYRWTGWRRNLLAGGLFLTLLLTQSLTMVVAFAVVSAVFMTIVIFSRAATFFRAMTVMVLAISLMTAVFLAYQAEISTAYRVFMAAKQGSIDAHAEVLHLFNVISPLGLLGVQPSTSAWGESTYANALVNLGLLYPLVFLGVGALAMLRYFRLLRHPGASRESRAFAAGGLAFLLAVYAGSVTLPMMEQFPVNLLAALHLGLAAGGLLPRPGRVPVRRRRPPHPFDDGALAEEEARLPVP